MKKRAFNENEFEEKYQRYSKLLFRTANQYLLDADAAEDVVQEVFVKLFTRNKRFKDGEHEKAWLIRVTVNCCKNRLTSPKSRETELFDSAAVEQTFEKDSEMQIDFERELKKLSPEQRTCIYLHYYEGYKITEISELLKMKENTVKSVLSRARQTLRTNFEKEKEYELQ